MVLLKYKLNNVCDPNRVRKPHWGSAQITRQVLYTTIYCGCQYESVKIMYIENMVIDAIRIISVLNVYYGDNAYCVRIKSVLGKYAFAHLQRPDGLILLLTPCIRAAHSCFLTSCGNLSFVIPTLLIW